MNYERNPCLLETETTDTPGDWLAYIASVIFQTSHPRKRADLLEQLIGHLVVAQLHQEALGHVVEANGVFLFLARSQVGAFLPDGLRLLLKGEDAESIVGEGHTTSFRDSEEEVYSPYLCQNSWAGAVRRCPVTPLEVVTW